jgi:hypothetical protein
MSRNGATITFRVESQGPFGVTVVTEAAQKAMLAGDQKSIKRSDVMLLADSEGPTYEGKVTIPAGTSVFILENRSTKPVEFHLQCFEGG